MLPSLALRAAVHDLDLEEQQWVEGLYAEARALLDEGLGLFAYTYTIAANCSIELGGVAGQASAPDFWRSLVGWGAANAAVLARIYRTGLGSLDVATRLAADAGVGITSPRELFDRHGVADLFTLAGHDPDGHGVFVTALRARRAKEPSPAERRALSHLASELAVASRLRARRRQTSFARLSAAEVRVARLLLEGASDKAIASALEVTPSTVATFARRLRRKLGCAAGEELFLLRSASFTPSLSRRLVLFERLTSSECDVASELLVGSTYAEIAARRGVSVRTIASQCAAVFRKCGVAGRRELAAAVLGSRRENAMVSDRRPSQRYWR